MEKISHNINKNKLGLLNSFLMPINKIFYSKYRKYFSDCCKNIFFAHSNNISQYTTEMFCCSYKKIEVHKKHFSQEIM